MHNLQNLSSQIINDTIFRLAIILVIENLVYLTTILLCLTYYRRQSKKLKELRKVNLYRIFDKTYISNFPSQTSKVYFRLHNKITLCFNFLIAITFVLYLIKTLLTS